jgi:hypothetical protein
VWCSADEAQRSVQCSAGGGDRARWRFRNGVALREGEMRVKWVREEMETVVVERGQVRPSYCCVGQGLPAGISLARANPAWLALP